MAPLKDFLPRAGMRYVPGVHVTGRQRRDRQILKGLERSATISAATQKNLKASKRVVDAMLADTLSVGLHPNHIRILNESGDLVEFLDSLRLVTHLGSEMSEASFVKLFQVLVDARREWKANPTNFLQDHEHSRTAKSIDELLRQTNDRWNDVHFAFFDLVGGFEEDENDNGGNMGENDDGGIAPESESQEVAEARMALEGMSIGGRDVDGEKQEDAEEESQEPFGDDMDIDG
ncbi:hypothetical protein GGR52DRAFT_573919 [Hypoxylon sp. FL1284]|nr:hypothetical protein GGR52DRAFT_573919 [Hypoxylon sp. FL1284]